MQLFVVNQREKQTIIMSVCTDICKATSEQQQTAPQHTALLISLRSNLNKNDNSPICTLISNVSG